MDENVVVGRDRDAPSPSTGATAVVVIRVVGQNGPIVEVGREDERVLEDPLHNQLGFRLFALLQIFLSTVFPAGKVPIEVHSAFISPTGCVIAAKAFTFRTTSKASEEAFFQLLPKHCLSFPPHLEQETLMLHQL